MIVCSNLYEPVSDTRKKYKVRRDRMVKVDCDIYTWRLKVHPAYKVG